MKNADVQNLFDCSGEVAIVTGGLGLLGGEYVKTLVGAGARVSVFDIETKVSPAIQTLIGTKKVLVYRVDITKRSGVRDAMNRVKKVFGSPTILINNAGINTTPHIKKENGLYENYPERAWDAIIDSHLKGAFIVSQEFLKTFRASKKSRPSHNGASITKRAGSIINISSTYGVVTPDQSLYEFLRKNGKEFYKPVAYSVAKSGMLNFTRWLAEYCIQSGIDVRVNTLVPGGVLRGQDRVFVKEYARRTILGRMARKDEYNGAILFLASRASSYMTGSTLVVDGGWTAR